MTDKRESAAPSPLADDAPLVGHKKSAGNCEFNRAVDEQLRAPHRGAGREGEERMNVQRQMSNAELADIEVEMAEMIDHWIVAYKTFPTAENFDGVLDRLRAYQTAWMNGRRRIKGGDDAC